MPHGGAQWWQWTQGMLGRASFMHVPATQTTEGVGDRWWLPSPRTLHPDGWCTHHCTCWTLPWISAQHIPDPTGLQSRQQPSQKVEWPIRWAPSVAPAAGWACRTGVSPGDGPSAAHTAWGCRPVFKAPTRFLNSQKWSRGLINAWRHCLGTIGKLRGCTHLRPANLTCTCRYKGCYRHRPQWPGSGDVDVHSPAWATDETFPNQKTAS